MSLPQKNPLQRGFPYTQSGGQPTQAFAQYMEKLDALVAALAGGEAPPLVSAANDAAAAAAGVSIGNFYRNGSILMVRVA